MKRTAKLYGLILLAAVTVFAAYRYSRPVPPLTAWFTAIPAAQAAPVSLTWPPAAQAALGAEKYGILEKHGYQTPRSIASVAKVITALAVLEKKPLAVGESGPTITLDSTDTGYFDYYYTHDGSVANVSSGEQITEYQMLEAMLIPSANNIADSLARWAFGSTQAYITYANQMVKKLGLTTTTVGNTNGFDDTTLSTAEDLVRLGLKAIQDPVISSVVSRQTADIPVQGLVRNVNWLLGSYGIDGIKTGNTDKAGGVYLFSAKHQISGRPVEYIGSVVGAPDLAGAINAGRDLVSSADKNWVYAAPLTAGQTVGTINSAWGRSSELKISQTAGGLAWKDSPPKVSFKAVYVSAPVMSGATAGTASVRLSGQTISVPIKTVGPVPGPSWYWRIVR